MSDDANELRPCAHCGNSVSPDAELCPHCGARFQAQSAGSSVMRSFVSLLGFLVALVLGLCGSCFLYFGLINPDTGGLSGMGVVLVPVGVGILYCAFWMARAARGRRS